MRGLETKEGEHLAWRAVLGLLIAGSVGVILLAGVVVHVLVRDFTAGVSASGLRPFDGGGGNAPGTTPVPGATALPPLEPINAQPWNGSTRVTILVMGLDYRDWEAVAFVSTTTPILR